jgi:predicted metalloprotease with PDZ domain
MQPAPIRYSIVPSDPAAHLLEVRCTLPEPVADGQRFALPAWIPGSYLIRDFARHIVAIRAESAGQPVAPAQARQTHLAGGAGRQRRARASSARSMPGTSRYAVRTSTRRMPSSTAAASSCAPLGHEDGRAWSISSGQLGNASSGWRVATTLPLATGEPGAARRHGFGLYRAANYDELIDHPVEMGCFTLAAFSACGVRTKWRSAAATTVI